jgi:hypothetical protein
MSLGHDVVAEAGYNWYLRDINIFSLSKELWVGIKGELASIDLYVF